ncbi:MAG: restriction endonuclease PLD domain-containing protein [Candidatus Anammoxibacter sp.]
MLTDNLYKKILIDPFKKDSNLDRLLIVSGYATSAMGFHYLNELKEINKDINVELIVGMTSRDGLSLSNHNGFKKLVNEDFSENFKCSYIKNSPPVHSKLYVWCKNNIPKLAFTGSANYTQTALRMQTQKEVMTECDHRMGYEYIKDIIPKTIYCQHPEAEQEIIIFKDNRYFYSRKEAERHKVESGNVSDYFGLTNVTVSFLDSKGKLPQSSGLNWGHRKNPTKNKRELNQAYIRLTSDIYKTDFFPPNKIQFTLLTDDGKTLICTRAQENGKAIETPQNNSLLGEYFRNRLNLPNGALVLKEHLERYGRIDVAFYKIDDETYYMDFAP